MAARTTPVLARSTRRRRALVCATAIAVALVGVIVGPSTADGASSAPSAGSPSGRLIDITQHPGGVSLLGWASDPDTSKAIRVVVNIDHKRVATVTANRSSVYHGRHRFAASVPLTEGTHRVCAWAANTGRGQDVWLRCQTLTFDYGPLGKLSRLTTRPGSIWAKGWAYDADKPGAAVTVNVIIDGTRHTVRASRGRSDVRQLTSTTGTAHGFSPVIRVSQGKHHVCVTATNIGYGSDTTLLCRDLVVDDSPIGGVEPIGPRQGKLHVRGWAMDPDRPTSPVTIDLTIDGKPTTLLADVSRPDLAPAHPGTGNNHGFEASYALPEGTHRVCLTARNVGAGSDHPLQCETTTLSFSPVAWLYQAKMTSTGATITGWAVDPDTSSPIQARVTVDGGQPKTLTADDKGPYHNGHRFTVSMALTAGSHTVCATGINVGYGTKDSVPACRTFTFTPPGSAPAAQKTPAPVSTSRYIRNVRGSSAAELAMMRREGAADATANPTGHRYLILLDIGGQDQYDGGVVLSATTRFVTYGDLVRDVQAYTAGYHSTQRSRAPVTIAIGTNNDMDVSYSSGQAWAQKVINPIASNAHGYANMSIVGANDIEPGFRASYSATKNWLSGYLAGTSRPFVFNGSADGCAWTVTNRGCNNGWSMSGLYQLAAGAAPTRIVNLPQIYNNTMADQWKYISLTGIGQSHPRINFGGPLTEWTACAQDGGCGSLTGRNAWAQLWNNLQSDPRLKVTSLPYATDLRIDR